MCIRDSTLALLRGEPAGQPAGCCGGSELDERTTRKFSCHEHTLEKLGVMWPKAPVARKRHIRTACKRREAEFAPPAAAKPPGGRRKIRRRSAFRFSQAVFKARGIPGYHRILCSDNQDAFAGGTRKTAVNALYSPTAATSRLAPAFGAADVIGGLI